MDWQRRRCSDGARVDVGASGACVAAFRPGKPSVDHADIPQEEQLRILRKLFDRFYEETVEEGSFLFPDVQETLSALHAKGIPLGLVTNKPTPFVAPLLEALNIAKYFSVIVGGDDVQNKSPIRNRCCWWQENYP